MFRRTNPTAAPELGTHHQQGDKESSHQLPLNDEKEITQVLGCAILPVNAQLKSHCPLEVKEETVEGALLIQRDVFLKCFCTSSTFGTLQFAVYAGLCSILYILHVYIEVS